MAGRHSHTSLPHDVATSPYRQIPMSIRTIRYRVWLIIIFIVIWAISAIKPVDWETFIVEHIFTVVLPVVIFLLMRGRPLSDFSCSLIFVYLLLHVIGAHYTYTQVPYDRWFETLFGWNITDIFHFQRNHFDRLVHFLWGLMLWRPMYEVVQYRLKLTGERASFVAITILATMSAIYEMIEWLATMILSPQSADAYNGQQGDMFDAQKDAGLALVGSILAALIFALHESIASRNKRSPDRREPT
jgi:putative membrane protein